MLDYSRSGHIASFHLVFWAKVRFATISRRPGSRISGPPTPLSMAIHPLAPVTNYQSTLNRIFWFTSAAALGAVWLLRRYIPTVDGVLSQVDFQLQTGTGKLLPIAGGYLLPALGMGLISRIFRIHGHIGHWLGIRERFEIFVILVELARQVDIHVEAVAEEEWLAHRHDLMRKTFYQFASSRSPQIDEHLVHQALDLWSWFWIVLEAAVVFVATGLILIAAGCYEIGLVTFGAAILAACVCLPAIRLQCRQYAIAQVRAILADPAREAAVRREFSVIEEGRSQWKRAA